MASQRSVTETSATHSEVQPAVASFLTADPEAYALDEIQSQVLPPLVLDDGSSSFVENRLPISPDDVRDLDTYANQDSVLGGTTSLSQQNRSAIAVGDSHANNLAVSVDAASSVPSHGNDRLSKHRAPISTQAYHQWLGSLLSLITLTLALISLLIYAVRSYRMSVWTTRNDELQACAGLIQAERPIGPNCERLIADGPQDPPYNLSRRASHPLEASHIFNFSDNSAVNDGLFIRMETHNQAWLALASIWALVFLANFLLGRLRHCSTTEDTFESLVGIEAAPTILQDRNEMLPDLEDKATYSGAHHDPQNHLRKRIRIGQGSQEAPQNETRTKLQGDGGGGIPYSIARYLDQPLGEITWEENLVRSRLVAGAPQEDVRRRRIISELNVIKSMLSL